MKKAPIIVLSGASGSGKTTLCRMAADRHGYYYVISHTTRPMRTNETEGEHYHFVSRAQFESMKKTGEFIEWAEIYGNLYGTAKSEALNRLQRGEGVILDLDPQGALAIRKILPDALLIFVRAPSREALEERLSKRGTESEEAKLNRLKQAEAEEAHKDQYDHVIVNQDLNQAFSELENILRIRYPATNADS